MNVIDYITITCNIKKNGRLQITSDYMIKCNRLQLITITNYDDPMSANQHQELPVAAMFVKGSGLNEQSLQLIFMENVMTLIPYNEGMRGS